MCVYLLIASLTLLQIKQVVFVFTEFIFVFFLAVKMKSKNIMKLASYLRRLFLIFNFQNLANHEKKETGSLVTRNLGPLVKEEVY